MKLYLIYLWMYMIQNVLPSNTTCSDFVYMKIPYNAKLINGHSGEATCVISVYRCLELCRDDVLCKSVGIDASSMDCYLYDGRVYAGLPGTVNTDMVYYWQLEAECPLHLGYSEDPTSKICMKYYSDLLNWTDAQKKCEKDGGHLLTLDSTDKLNIAIKYAGNIISQVPKVYVGTTDIEEESVWNWLNGVPVDINQFSNGKPSNSNGKEHCAAFYFGEKKMNDVPCYFKCAFGCEVPTKYTFANIS